MWVTVRSRASSRVSVVYEIPQSRSSLVSQRRTCEVAEVARRELEGEKAGRRPGCKCRGTSPQRPPEQEAAVPGQWGDRGLHREPAGWRLIESGAQTGPEEAWKVQTGRSVKGPAAQRTPDAWQGLRVRPRTGRKEPWIPQRGRSLAKGHPGERSIALS